MIVSDFCFHLSSRPCSTSALVLPCSSTRFLGSELQQDVTRQQVEGEQQLNVMKHRHVNINKDIKMMELYL